MSVYIWSSKSLETVEDGEPPPSGLAAPSKGTNASIRAYTSQHVQGYLRRCHSIDCGYPCRCHSMDKHASMPSHSNATLHARPGRASGDIGLPGYRGTLLVKNTPFLGTYRRRFDNHLVRIHFIIVMIRWAGLAPREFECKHAQPLECNSARTPWQRRWRARPPLVQGYLARKKQPPPRNLQ